MAKPNLALAFDIQRRNKRKKYANGGQVGLAASQKEHYDKKDPLSDKYDQSHPEHAHRIKQNKQDLKDLSVMINNDKMRNNPANKHRYAEGGAVYARDQFKSHPKKNPKLGDEYEGDEEPGQPKTKADDARPANKSYMGKEWAGGKGETPQDSDEHSIDKKDYQRQRYADGGNVDAADMLAKFNGYAQDYKKYRDDHKALDDMKKMTPKGYAHGGGVYDREPGQPMAKEDNHRPDINNYENDDWTGEDGEPGSTDMHSFEGPSHEEYMAAHFAEGGLIPCAHCHGLGHDSEEGPATDISYNIDAKDYDQEEGAEGMGHSDRDSNEHGDEEEDEEENEHDRVGKIHKKLKARRG